ncbi:MAG: hypothetical protein COS99_07275 [Candidatus Omnitrophica bacterium CG07_land_8_20_14_0_80_42_15]|uniref:RNA polymerase sigma factor 70 region 4 type 2 domain-containing protein n=1 Tax=Candidatus Aquitaenariimonas noxiae TaxID=1974741 RepID=A0A2J0KRA1_9BACT|nr:MAG: hypothetical protein COS99_07275 [Candidatus Omnitrophica bacterium CG07_land_8_20_14_0_80_42_15]
MKANIDIKSLIEGCIKKDESSWSEFIYQFKNLVNWAAIDRLKRWGIEFTNDDIDDIRQQVFMGIWEKNRLSEIRNRERIAGWLAMVAGNCAFNYIRSKKRFEIPASEPSLELELKLENVKDKESPYSALENSETRTAIEEFINKLPQSQQAILILNYVYEKKYREISEILKIPINTVSTIIKRSRDSLKKELKEKGVI